MIMIRVPTEDDQCLLLMISGTVIESFPQAEVTLDIAVGKLFSESNSEERKRPNQENVHGHKIKEVPRLASGAEAGATGDRPRLFDQPKGRPRLPKQGLKEHETLAQGNDPSGNLSAA